MKRAPRWPSAVERGLAARLRRRQRVARLLVLEHLRSLPRLDSQRADGWLGDRIRQIGQRVLEALGIAAPSSFTPTARAVDAIVTAEVERVLEQPAPVIPMLDPGREATRAWAEAASRRVRELEVATVTRGIDAAIVAAEQGADPEAAAREAMASAEVRGALAARDLVGDLVHAVTEVRSRQLGADSYRWRTKHDDRVREAHQKLDGKIRRWSEPHETEGHPGTAPLCRCTAEPIRTALVRGLPTRTP